MLISHRKKFIYTKTVKTAGTSVEVFFEKWCLPPGKWKLQHARPAYRGKTGIIGGRGEHVSLPWYNHMPASHIKNQISEDVWNNYFKFCVIRNPFDKAVSAFYFLHDKTAGVGEFREWLMRVGAKNAILDRDRYMIGGEICVDYFIKYEKLFEGICEVCKRLKIPQPSRSSIPKLKTGRRRRGIILRDYYDKRCLRMIENIFRFELQHFGYDYTQ
jgi:hypothetical protein